MNVVGYSLLLSVLEYQTAVMREDFETAKQVRSMCYLGTVMLYVSVSLLTCRLTNARIKVHVFSVCSLISLVSEAVYCCAVLFIKMYNAM